MRLNNILRTSTQKSENISTQVESTIDYSLLSSDNNIPPENMPEYVKSIKSHLQKVSSNKNGEQLTIKDRNLLFDLLSSRDFWMQGDTDEVTGLRTKTDRSSFIDAEDIRECIKLGCFVNGVYEDPDKLDQKNENLDKIMKIFTAKDRGNLYLNYQEFDYLKFEGFIQDNINYCSAEAVMNIVEVANKEHIPFLVREIPKFLRNKEISQYCLSKNIECVKDVRSRFVTEDHLINAANEKNFDCILEGHFKGNLELTKKVTDAIEENGIMLYDTYTIHYFLRVLVDIEIMNGNKESDEYNEYVKTRLSSSNSNICNKYIGKLLTPLIKKYGWKGNNYLTSGYLNLEEILENMEDDNEKLDLMTTIFSNICNEEVLSELIIKIREAEDSNTERIFHSIPAEQWHYILLPSLIISKYLNNNSVLSSIRNNSALQGGYTKAIETITYSDIVRLDIMLKPNELNLDKITQYIESNKHLGLITRCNLLEGVVANKLKQIKINSVGVTKSPREFFDGMLISDNKLGEMLGLVEYIKSTALLDSEHKDFMKFLYQISDDKIKVINIIKDMSNYIGNYSELGVSRRLSELKDARKQLKEGIKLGIIGRDVDREILYVYK